MTSPELLHIPFSEYLSIEAVSASQLKKLDQSPAHLKWELDHDDAPTKAMDLGTAIHCAVLEPKRYAKEYAVGPECDLRLKAGKIAWAAFQEERPGKTLLRAHEGEVVWEIMGSIGRSSAAQTLLRNDGPTEVSVIWDDAETGKRCKCRPDKHYQASAGPVLVDLKSVQTANPNKLRYHAVANGWHLQDAHYREAFGPDARMVFICFEKTAPYACCALEFTPTAREVNQSERLRLLHLLDRCKETGEWPDYSDRIYAFDLPASFYSRADTEPLQQEEEPF